MACIFVMSASLSNAIFHSKWLSVSESHLSAIMTSTEPRFAAIVMHSEEKPGPSGVLSTYWEGCGSRFILSCEFGGDRASRGVFVHVTAGSET